MYRMDKQLDAADARLRLYFAWRDTLPGLLDEAKEVSEKLNSYGVVNQASVVISNEKKNYNSNIIELMDKEEKLWTEYRNRKAFVVSVEDILSSLTNEEAELINMRYCDKLHLRQIGDILNYSHVQIMRMIDDILEKF